MLSHAETVHPFVGFSIFNCVPTAIKFSVMPIVAGWSASVEYPLFLHLPYLSLNPPDSEGCEKTGLPATKS